MNADFPTTGHTGTPARSSLARSRNLPIAVVVVALHAGLLWALQSGLLMRAAEIIVPVEVLVQFIEPRTPEVVLPKPVPVEAARPPAPLEKPKPAPAPARPQLRVEPVPSPVPQPNRAPSVPVASSEPALEAATPAPPAPPSPPAPPTAVAPAAVQLPSSDADYLQNPKPPYPPMSKRLGEQGKTTIRVLIGSDGRAQRGEIAQSSGFDRLDQAALATALRWRYVPGKRDGVAEAMWFSVPINWVLE